MRATANNKIMAKTDNDDLHSTAAMRLTGKTSLFAFFSIGYGHDLLCVRKQALTALTR